MNVLFVCVHNAGRSQMAEAFLNHFAGAEGLSVRAKSAGTIGGKSLNPVAMSVMSEIGISMEHQDPKLLTAELVQWADRTISMGCGVDAAACPAKFLLTEDWQLEDPAGKDLDAVREIRDQIKERVLDLIKTVKSEGSIPSLN